MQSFLKAGNPKNIDFVWTFEWKHGRNETHAFFCFAGGKCDSVPSSHYSRYVTGRSLELASQVLYLLSYSSGCMKNIFD